MEINKFIDSLKDVFEDTDPALLTPDCYFKELDEYSSLTALALIAVADENYDVAIKSADIRQADTISDLFNLIVSKK